jgi:hypothetical protein
MYQTFQSSTKRKHWHFRSINIEWLMQLNLSNRTDIQKQLSTKQMKQIKMLWWSSGSTSTTFRENKRTPTPLPEHHPSKHFNPRCASSPHHLQWIDDTQGRGIDDSSPTNKIHNKIPQIQRKTNLNINLHPSVTKSGETNYINSTGQCTTSQQPPFQIATLTTNSPRTTSD